MAAKLLIVDDDAGMCDFLRNALGRKGFEVNCALSADEAHEKIAADGFECVLTDINMPGLNGLELCERIVASRPDIPVIVLTSFGSFDAAVGAIRSGAYNFLTKPVEIDALVLALNRAVQHRALKEEVKRLSGLASGAARSGELLGESVVMRRVHELIAKTADSEMCVLVHGESGTGKELVARALHQQSQRCDGPFVASSLAAIPENMLELEFFGQARGDGPPKDGLLVKANGGTLFLDEVSDMSPARQSKLLRALEERKIRPIGSSEEISFDARIISATNRDLESAVEKGEFRQDLYFRLNGVEIALPPLKARGNDILLLAQHFTEEAAKRSGKAVHGLSNEVAERLLAYSWPGNVRELKNCIERAVTLTSFERITVADLPEKVASYTKSQLVLASDDPSALSPLEEVEKRYILHVVKTVGGNKTLASQILGLDRKTLYRRLEQYKDQISE